MRTEVSKVLAEGRLEKGVWASAPDWGLNGIFTVKGPSGALEVAGATAEGPQVLAVNGMRTVRHLSTGWEHVTVEGVHPNRTPTWDDMAFVKDLFWRPEEWVVQYHPAHSEYVKASPHRLHLWRPTRDKLPTPKKSLAERGF